MRVLRFSLSGRIVVVLMPTHPVQVLVRNVGCHTIRHRDNDCDVIRAGCYC